MASRLRASQVASLLKISCSRSRPSVGFRLPFSRGFAAVIEHLKYSDSHEWVKVDGSFATVGITDHAQDHLGDVVFVDLPDTGAVVSKGANFGAVESVKATSDVISPVSGEVVELNSKLNSSPGLINASPYDEGWIIKVHMNNPSEVDSLMDAEHYRDFCEKENSSH